MLGMSFGQYFVIAFFIIVIVGLFKIHRKAGILGTLTLGIAYVISQIFGSQIL